MNWEEGSTELAHLRLWTSCDNDYPKNGPSFPNMSLEGDSRACGNGVKHVLTHTEEILETERSFKN